MDHHLIDHAYLPHFIFAGRSEFTIKDNEFNSTLACRVVQNPELPDMYWVHGAKQFLGTIWKQNFKVKESAVAQQHAHFFLKFFTLMITGKLPDSIVAYHHNKCGKCSRPLTDPVSITQGIGPECRKRLGI